MYKYLNNIQIDDTTELSHTVDHINSIQPNINKSGKIWNNIPFKVQNYMGSDNISHNFLCDFRGNINLNTNKIKKSDIFRQSTTGNINEIIFDVAINKYKYNTIVLGNTIKIITYDFNSSEDIKSYLVVSDGSYYVYSIKVVGKLIGYNVTPINETKQFYSASDEMNRYKWWANNVINIPSDTYIKETRFIENILQDSKIHSFKSWYLNNKFYFSIGFFTPDNTFNILFNKDSETFCYNYNNLVYNTEDILTYDEYKHKHLYLYGGDLIKDGNNIYRIPFTMPFKSMRRPFFKQWQVGDDTENNSGIYYGIVTQDITEEGVLSSNAIKLYNSNGTPINDADFFKNTIFTEEIGDTSRFYLKDNDNYEGVDSASQYVILINGKQIKNSDLTWSDDKKVYYVGTPDSVMEVKTLTITGEDFDTAEKSTDESKKNTGVESEILPSIKKYSTIIIYKSEVNASIDDDDGGLSTYNLLTRYYGLTKSVICNNWDGVFDGEVEITKDKNDVREVSFDGFVSSKNYGSYLKKLKSYCNGAVGYDGIIQQLYDNAHISNKIDYMMNGDESVNTTLLKSKLSELLSVKHQRNIVYSDFRYNVSFSSGIYTFDFIIPNNTGYEIKGSNQIDTTTDNNFSSSLSNFKINFVRTVVTYSVHPDIFSNIITKNSKSYYIVGEQSSNEIYVVSSDSNHRFRFYSPIILNSNKKIRYIQLLDVNIVSTYINSFTAILFGNKTEYISVIDTDPLYNSVNIVNGIDTFNVTVTPIVENRNIRMVDTSKNYKVYKFDIGNGTQYFRRTKYYFKEIKLNNSIKQLNYNTMDMSLLQETFVETPLKSKKKRLNRRVKRKVKRPDTNFIYLVAIAEVLIKSSEISENEIKFMPCLIKTTFTQNIKEDFSFWEHLRKNKRGAIKDIYMEDAIPLTLQGESSLNYYLVTIHNVRWDVPELAPYNVNERFHFDEYQKFNDVFEEVNDFISDIENKTLYHYTVKNKVVTKTVKFPHLVSLLNLYNTASIFGKLSYFAEYRMGFVYGTDKLVPINKKRTFPLVDITLKYDDKVQLDVIQNYNITNNNGRTFEYQSNDFKVYYDRLKDYIVMSNRDVDTTDWNTVVYTKYDDNNLISQNSLYTTHLTNRVEFKDAICSDGTQIDGTNNILSNDSILCLKDNKIINNTTSFNQIPLDIATTDLIYILDDNGTVDISYKIKQGCRILGIYDNVEKMNY